MITKTASLKILCNKVDTTNVLNTNGMNIITINEKKQVIMDSRVKC